MKSVYPIMVVVIAAGLLLSSCAGANPSTAAILATNEAAAATSVAQIATSTEAANIAATGVILTQNAPPTPTPTPPTPLKPLVVAEYTPAADAQTPEQICADALPAKDPETRAFTQAEQVLKADVDYRAIFCTSTGAVYVDLLEAQTPITVNNFVFLAEQGYYNNTTFHRVINQFMAQGGDPTATGSGDPGYSFQDEFVPDLRFDGPGKLAMANSGPATNGSQFFITTVATAQLNDAHTIFGQVIEGQANVKNIRLRDPNNPPAASTPVAEVTAEATAADATAEATAEGTPEEATSTQEPTVVSNPPGEALNTVIIITDPSKVLTKEKQTATQDEVVKAFDGVMSAYGAERLNLLENITTTQTPEEAISAVPEAARPDLGKLFTNNQHEYRVTSLVKNKDCDLTQLQFVSVGYTLDAYATAGDASNVLADENWAKSVLQSGFTDQKPSGNLPYPVFTQQITACDQPSVRALTYWQRGAFIASAEVTVPVSANFGEVLDRILAEYVGGTVYEKALATVLYKDIE